MAAYNDMDYFYFMSLTPAIFYIIIEQKNKRFNDTIMLANNYFGQICATVANSAGSKKLYKPKDFFGSADNEKPKKVEDIPVQSVDDMAQVLEEFCNMFE